MSDKVNRAAQFLPFDSLKGLQDELRRREEKFSRVEKIELCEDKKELISNELLKAEKGSIVEVTFYFNGHYVTLTDKLEGKNFAYKYIVVNNSKIYFDDIYDFKIISI